MARPVRCPIYGEIAARARGRPRAPAAAAE